MAKQTNKTKKSGSKRNRRNRKSSPNNSVQPSKSPAKKSPRETTSFIGSWNLSKVLLLAPRADQIQIIEDAINDNDDDDFKNMAIHVCTTALTTVYTKRHAQNQGSYWQAVEIVREANRNTISPRVEHFIGLALGRYLPKRKLDLLTEFYESLGIEHSDHDKVPEWHVLDKHQVQQACDDLGKQHGIEWVVVLLVTQVYIADIKVQVQEMNRGNFDRIEEVFLLTASLLRKQLPGPKPSLDELDSPKLAPVIPMKSTPLDNLFHGITVATVAEENSAISVPELQAIIEELIALDSRRYQSYFHRGFLNALAKIDNKGAFLEKNELRVQWELAGKILAFTRLDDKKSILELWDKSKADMLQLNQSHPAAPRVLQYVWKALWDSGRHDEAISDLLSVEAVAASTLEFKEELLETAREHRFTGSLQEAKAILDLLDEAITGSENEQEHSFEVKRELSVCMRSLGMFKEASSLIRQLEKEHVKSIGGGLSAILALSEARFRSLSDLSIFVHRNEKKGFVERINSHRKHFDAGAKGQDSTARAIANYALGVAAFLDGKNEDSKIYFSSAFAATLTSNAKTVRKNIQFLNNLKLSFAISELLSQSDHKQADDLLASLSEPFQSIPEWIVKQLIENALIIEDADLRTNILESIWRLIPDSHEVFAENKFNAQLLPGLAVESFETKFFNESTSAGDRWRYGEWLLRRHVAQMDSAKAAVCLDQLEEIALLQQEHRKKYVKLLTENDLVSSVWTSELAYFSLVNVYERDGKTLEATTLLIKLFHESASENKWDAAEGLIQRIKLYGLDDEYVTDCENRLNAAIRQGELNQASDPQGNPGQPVKVLFVGGDELEKRNDAAVLKQLEKKAPWITADFEHTGWSGHWGPTADKITNRLGQYDALIITPYIRTGFGMTLRKNVDDVGIPWTACTGRGRKTITQSILKAAIAVQDTLS